MTGNSNLDDYQVFSHEVRHRFVFLEKDYGYSIVQDKVEGDVAFIRFESPEVFVTLWFGPPEYDVQLSFGRIGIDDQPGAFTFEPGDLLSLDQCKEWQWDTTYLDKIQSTIAEYARLMRSCGISCLRGDRAVYEIMIQQREALIREWLRDEKLQELRAKAFEAWSKKNYSEYVKLLEPVKEDLFKSELMKLEYARNKMEKAS